MLKRSVHGWEMETIKGPSTEERKQPNKYALDSGGIKDGMEHYNKELKTLWNFCH